MGEYGYPRGPSMPCCVGSTPASPTTKNIRLHLTHSRTRTCTRTHAREFGLVYYIILTDSRDAPTGEYRLSLVGEWSLSHDGDGIGQAPTDTWLPLGNQKRKGEGYERQHILPHS